MVGASPCCRAAVEVLPWGSRGGADTRRWICAVSAGQLPWLRPMEVVEGAVACPDGVGGEESGCWMKVMENKNIKVLVN